MKNYQKCDRVSIVALSVSAFLGIIAFIPGGLIPQSILKGYLVVACVLVAFIAWLLGRLIEGSFHIPWTPLLAAAGLVVFVTFISALFSHTPYLAFFGEGFEQGTFAVLGSLLLGLFLASMLFTTHRRIYTFLQGFFILYILLAVFQLIHVIFPAATALGTFSAKVDSPIGLWSDFAFLSGAVLVGSTLLLQFWKSMRKMRLVLSAGLVLSLFFVILANVLMVWIIVGFSSVLVLVYTLIANRSSEERRFPFLAFFVSLIALLFILANSLFGGVLANSLNATYVSVHPNIGATVHVSMRSLAQHPIVGAGPNRFMKEWLTNRPVAVNNSPLWDAPFSSGSSFFGTVAVLGGALGLIACILFLLAFGYESVRKLFVPESGQTSPTPIFGLFILALYFLLAALFFAPGIAVLACTFLFIGIFMGSLTGEKRIEEHTFNFLKDQRASFFSILCIVACLMLSAATVYAATERFAAIVFYQKSLANAQNNNFDLANTRLSQAIALADLPSFERTRVLYAEQSIKTTLALPSTSASSDSIRGALQNAISVGSTSAKAAVSLDPSDPANYLALGDLLRLLVPLKINGVVASADDAYQHAITIAPNYPKTYLDLAMLYYDSGDNAKARTYIQKAFEQKSNYTDAYFLLAQIEVSDGNTAAAIKRIQDATVIDPSNPDTYFELGLLRYNNGDYTNAISAFHTTLNINPQYLNAWYYLALADQKTGNTAEATTILSALHKRLPDNQSITDAMSGAAPAPILAAPTPPTPAPTNTKQEKAKKLPLPVTAPTTGKASQ